MYKATSLLPSEFDGSQRSTAVATAPFRAGGPAPRGRSRCARCAARSILHAGSEAELDLGSTEVRRALLEEAFAESESEEEFLGYFDPLAPIFKGIVASNIAVASHISIPSNPVSWRSRVLQYARANPLDGAVLVAALARLPTFHRGGWILSLVPGAGAMTLNNRVFVRGKLPLPTYVHELVHVFQYGTLGVSGFLTSYFGLSAATIAYRLVRRQPLDVMKSSPHETHAYNVEQRFDTWHTAQFGTSARTLTV